MCGTKFPTSFFSFSIICYIQLSQYRGEKNCNYLCFTATCSRPDQNRLVTRFCDPLVESHWPRPQKHSNLLIRINVALPVVYLWGSTECSLFSNETPEVFIYRQIYLYHRIFIAWMQLMLSLLHRCDIVSESILLWVGLPQCCSFLQAAQHQLCLKMETLLNQELRYFLKCAYME